jgi:hypothetical protein
MSFNLNQWFADNLSEDTLFYYKGSVGSEQVTEILDRIEAIIDEKKISLKERKKILNILIELVQNLYHHGEKFEIDDGFKSYGCIVFNSEDSGVKIISANFIKIEKLKVFTDYIDHTNSLSAEELKVLYRKVLSNNQFSEKGGGGLGIINMIRKSGNKLKYCSQRTKGENFFLVLTVKI